MIIGKLSQRPAGSTSNARWDANQIQWNVQNKIEEHVALCSFKIINLLAQ